MLKISAIVMAGMISLAFPPLLIVTVPLGLTLLFLANQAARSERRRLQAAILYHQQAAAARNYAEAGRYFA